MSRCVIPVQALHLNVEIKTEVDRPPATKEKYFFAVLSLTFLAGVAIAIGVYSAWLRGVLPAALSGGISWVALFFCPPYIMTVAVGPMADPELMAVVMAISIVFGNGFLYAGVGAGLYYVAKLLFSRRHA